MIWLDSSDERMAWLESVDVLDTNGWMLMDENLKTQMLHTLHVFCQNLNSQLDIYELTITVSNFDLILMSISAKNQSLFYIFVLWFRTICIKIK